MEMDYTTFQVEDFVADEYFVRWVKRPDQQSEAFWNAWLSKNPGCATRVQAAKEIVLHLDFKPNLPPEGKFLEIWDKIARAEPGELTTTSHTTNAQPARRKIWTYGIAAALALFITFVFIYVQPKEVQQEISTSYGESRTVSLPDSTKVTLNSNSNLSFSRSGTNEVFLEGEAFFSVTHKVGTEKFIVHTKELNIEVVGTKFNVNSRRGNTKVILKEGKVILHKLNGDAEKLVMVPGEYVEFGKDGELKRKMVDADNYLEWRNNRLIFVGTSLREIGQLLEDNYGYEVVFGDTSIQEREFTGSSSAVDIEELFEKLSRIYDLDVEKNGNKVIVNRNKEPAMK